MEGTLAARWRGTAPIALLASIAALGGGAAALAPAPAAAAVNQGEECDPSQPALDCEPTNGGGGGGGSSGSTDGSGAGEDQTIGEAIYVEGTLPASPCGIWCLPSHIGGSRPGFLDRGGKDPRAPRARGRLTRVGEAPKGKAGASQMTKDECGLLERRMRSLEEEVNARSLQVEDLFDHLQDLEALVALVREQRMPLDRELNDLNAAWRRDAEKIKDVEKKLADLNARIDSLDRKSLSIRQRISVAKIARAAMVSGLQDERARFAAGNCSRFHA